MSDPTNERIEPTIEPTAERPAPAPELVPPAQTVAAPRPATVEPASLDQLLRIEEKAARIEEKFARSEAALTRLEGKVEFSTDLAGALARQESLSAVHDRVRRLPGYGALFLAALVAAVLASVMTVALLQLVPGILVR